MDSVSCSHRCTSCATLVRGAPGVQAPARPVTYFGLRLLLLLRSFLLPRPSPKCSVLYCFTVANPCLSQYRSRAPAVFSEIGFGITPFLTHLRSVPRSM